MVSQSCYNQELMTGCCNSFGFGFTTLNPNGCTKTQAKSIKPGKRLTCRDWKTTKWSLVPSLYTLISVWIISILLTIHSLHSLGADKENLFKN